MCSELAKTCQKLLFVEITCLWPVFAISDMILCIYSFLYAYFFYGAGWAASPCSSPSSTSPTFPNQRNVDFSLVWDQSFFCQISKIHTRGWRFKPHLGVSPRLYKTPQFYVHFLTFHIQHVYIMHIWNLCICVMHLWKRYVANYYG